MIVLYIYTLKENGVKLHSVLENLNDSPESVILESVLDGIAEYYSLNLAREVQKGKKENAYKCKFNGGFIPLGYDVNPISNQYIINDSEAKTIRKIFEMYLIGYSLIDITIYLNEHGYKTKKGQEFKKNSIYDILGSEKYTGMYVYNKGYKGRKRASREDTITIENGMPSIITKEEFELVLAKRKKNKKRTGSYRPVDAYILSGILTCSKCGSPYYGQKSKRNKKDVTYSYHKYMCSHRNKIDKCTGANINRDDIETLVMNELQKLLLLPSNLDILVNKVNEKYLELNDNNNIDSSNVENELKVVQNKINNFMRLIADGIYNDDIKNNISNLEDEKNNLSIKLKSYTDVPKIKKISKADILDYLKLDIKNLKNSDYVILKLLTYAEYKNMNTHKSMVRLYNLLKIDPQVLKFY